MDLREKKTRRSIRRAFLQLRRHKPLEKITIRELAELAEISKATFYLHYRDIYDLSEQLQEDVIRRILETVTDSGISLLDGRRVSLTLFGVFRDNQEEIDILFSDSQSPMLPVLIERGVRKFVFESNPEAAADPRISVLLTFEICGCYQAYSEHCQEFGSEKVLEILDGFCLQLQNQNR